MFIICYFDEGYDIIDLYMLCQSCPIVYDPFNVLLNSLSGIVKDF